MTTVAPWTTPGGYIFDDAASFNARAASVQWQSARPCARYIERTPIRGCP
jgi:hypothetical protein